MRNRLSLFAVPLAWVAACGDGAGPTGGAGSGGTNGAQAGTASAGLPGVGGSAGAGGSTGGGAGTTSGAAGSGGATTAGGGGAGGASAQGGTGMAGSGGNAGSSGAVAGAGSGGVAGAGGAPAGGATAGGMAGSAGGATGGTGNVPVCTRELLSGTIDAYFDALAAHDPAPLPLAPSVKFTENGEDMELGDGGLWETAGALVHVHSALDVETCQSASQAVVPDGNTNIPLALRLKLVDGAITEIETIAVRQGDYSVTSDPQALVMSATSVGWETPVESGERNTRSEITGWMNKYFRMFPQGVCNTTSGCIRIENGGGDYNCNLGGSCASREPGPNDDELVPRLIFADVERGLGVGFTMFMGNTDMHLFKMRGGDVYGVSAILGSAGASGW
jgi:hypothetical protein